MSRAIASRWAAPCAPRAIDVRQTHTGAEDIPPPVGIRDSSFVVAAPALPSRIHPMCLVGEAYGHLYLPMHLWTMSTHLCCAAESSVEPSSGGPKGPKGGVRVYM